jgi:hypothetical protein
MSPSAGPIAYEVDDGIPATIRIIPSELVPETSRDGVPTTMLFVTGDTGILNVGTRWWPTESALTTIRQQLATAMDRSPAEFVVTPDAFVVTTVKLILVPDAASGSIELARTTSSGLPPFTALFFVTARDHLDALRRACMGEPGLLFVELEAELTRGRSATTTLAAEVGPWAAGLSNATGPELIARVDATVAAGALHRTRSAVPGTDPTTTDRAAYDPAADASAADLAAEADRMAAERFVAALREPTSGASSIAVAATAHGPQHTVLTRRADVGSWLRSSPERHLLVVDGAAGPSAGATTTALQRPVGLGFGSDGTPVATIELTGSGEPTTLHPPFPEAMVAADDKLTVTTRYSGGGASYRVVLPLEGAGWSLSAADLGLVEVSVDASRLRTAGATAVRTEVFYQPEDRGSPEHRTVLFGGDVWQARWFVVSRSPDLAGRLLVNPTVTPDGLSDTRQSLQWSIPTVQL